MLNAIIKIMRGVFIGIFLICWLLWAEWATAGTCTTVTRSNAAANSVLSSSLYNGDLNTIIEGIWGSSSGSLDGGCVSDGTLEDGALSTDFAALTNYLHHGWKCNYSDSNTISISLGGGAIDGDFVKTTTATTWTWGGAGDAAEATGTAFYLYGTTSSTGSTLDVVGSTSAPAGDGYSSTSKALCKFFNNTESNIASESISQWVGNKFNPDFSVVRVKGAVGWGSTNNKIPYFDTILQRFGDSMTYVQSASAGDSFTFSQSGVVHLTLGMGAGGADSCVFGFSKNSNELTTIIQSITSADRLNTHVNTAGSNNIDGHSVSVEVNSGDTIRPHAGGSGTCSTSGTDAFMNAVFIPNS